jgi:hypothetical protein
MKKTTLVFFILALPKMIHASKIEGNTQNCADTSFYEVGEFGKSGVKKYLANKKK